MYICRLGKCEVVRQDDVCGPGTYRLGLPYSLVQVDVRPDMRLIDLYINGNHMDYAMFDTEKKRKWFLTTFLYGWADGDHQDIKQLFQDCATEAHQYFNELAEPLEEFDEELSSPHLQHIQVSNQNDRGDR